MLTREEWGRAAEKAAAEAHGRENKGFYAARHYAPYWIGVFLLAALGFGGWWLVDRLGRALHGGVHLSPPGHLSVLFFVATGILVLATIYAFRPGRIDRLGVLAVKGLIVGAGWVFLAVYLIGYAVG